MRFFVEAVEQKRLGEAMSQAEFARRLGVSPSMWSRIRAGKQEAPRQLLLRLIARWPDLALVLAQHRGELEKGVGV